MLVSKTKHSITVQFELSQW